MYTIRFNMDDSTIIEIENFSISKQFSADSEKPSETSMMVTFLCAEDAIENYLNQVGDAVTKVEVFLQEDNSLIYSSAYWTCKRNIFISFNAAKDSMVAELFLIH